MPSLLSNALGHTFVRGNRTGDANIRKAEGSSHRSPTSLEPHELILHYLDRERTHVCQCTDPTRHSEGTSCVALESRHLSADLTLYLERHNLQSCAIKDLWDYEDSQDEKWAAEDVYAGNFHYTNRDKDVVCRCLCPWNHYHGMTRSFEIIEQCAEFFCVYKGELVVTKEQWTSFEHNPPPRYSSTVQDRFDHSRTSQDNKKKHGSTVSSEREVRSTAERITPILPNHSRHASTREVEPGLQPEMPPEVWQRGRSSLSKAQTGVESAFSTPMGTVPPSPSASPSMAPNMTQCAYTSTSRPQFRCEAYQSDDKDSTEKSDAREWLTGLAYTRASIRSAWEDKAIRALIKRFPDLEVSEDAKVPKSSKAQATGSYGAKADLPISKSRPARRVFVPIDPPKVNEEYDHRLISRCRPALADNGLWYRDRLYYQKYGDLASQLTVEELSPRGRPVRLPDSNLNMAVPYGSDDRHVAKQTPVAELSGRRSPVELPATPIPRQHTTTLETLEGRGRNAASKEKVRNPMIQREQAVSDSPYSNTRTAFPGRYSSSPRYDVPHTC